MLLSGWFCVARAIENSFRPTIRGDCPHGRRKWWAAWDTRRRPPTYSDVEENRLVVALHADVEAVERDRAAGLLVGNQRPTAVGRHDIEDGVSAVGCLVGEIQPRIDLPQHAAREDADHDMRRLRLAVGAGDRARLDGVEAVDAVLVGGGTAEAGELGVRPRLLAAGMGVAPLAIGLPYFDHGVVDRLAVAVGDTTLDADLL